MTKIDFFNSFTLALLETLYSEFPSKISIDTAKISVNLIPEGMDEMEAMNLIYSADDAIRFLSKEGFITATENSSFEGSHFHDVQLTLRGLAVLNSTPNSLSPGETVISKVRSVTAEGLRNVAVDSISSIAKTLFTVANNMLT